tara:strand:+ start:1259 stop:1651 length:393 start_codon:yes stop_codon:yes gene_type:complete
MKEIILTITVALFCLGASAQYRVMSNVNEPVDGGDWGFDNFTNNITVGYQMNSSIMVGVQKNSDDYGFVGRYNLNDMIYFSAEVPSENMSDSITWGVGASFRVWNELYIEPNYTIKNNDGSLNVGLSYKL